MPKIDTPIGPYKYTLTSLYLGCKRINKTVAFNNLILFKSIADKYSLNFVLLYGTLLGAIREHDFIDHDEDIDLGVLYINKDKLLSMLFELHDNGFDVARWDDRGLLSITNNGEYIDIYLFKDYTPKLLYCCGEPLPKNFLCKQVKINFKGIELNIPQNYIEALEFSYGNNWRTPIQITDYNIPKWQVALYKAKDIIKYCFPSFIKRPLLKIKENKILNKYMSSGVLDKYIE